MAAVELDFAGLNARLLSQCPALLKRWFPNGKVEGQWYVVGNLRGEEGQSLKVDLRNGIWKDYNTLDAGHDLIALYAGAQGISQGEAFDRLGGDKGVLVPVPGSATRAAPSNVLTYMPATMAPVPDFAAAQRSIATFQHPKYGLPTDLYSYENVDGELLYWVARYDLPPKDGKRQKTFCPWTWVGDAWRPQGPDGLKPLYGLPSLKRWPDKTVVIVEGEKCVNALRTLVAQPVVSMSGGVAGVKKADWAALRDRKVLIWPDNDEPGLKAAQETANRLIQLDCQVRAVDVTGQPDKWDAADGVADGWDNAALMAWLKPRIRDYVDPARQGVGSAPSDVTAEIPAAQRGLEALWRAAGLELSKKGPWTNTANMSRILDYSLKANVGTEIWFDTFLARVLHRSKDGPTLEWHDENDTRLCSWAQTAFGMPTLRITEVKRCVMEFAQRHARNCVQDWLKGLKWDGEERLPTFLPLALGAEQNAYTAAVGRCFFVSMVARAMQPGCKCDYMMVLSGAQGLKKSTTLLIIGGAWYAEIHEQINTTKFAEATMGKMLCEISDLQAFKRSEVEGIKAAVSRQVDRYRRPYDTHARDYPRQSILAGTTNQDEWQADQTGGRRFWPVACGDVDVEYTRDNREQLFAEAMVRWQRGEAWWDVPGEAALYAQEQVRERHPWTEPVLNYATSFNVITTVDVLKNALEIPKHQWSISSQMAVGAILRNAGWTKTFQRPQGGGAPRKCYMAPGVRPETRFNEPPPHTEDDAPEQGELPDIREILDPEPDQD